MKVKFFIMIVWLSLLFPGFSYGFGILRYVSDGIANQLGLDRGPIPKVIQTPRPPAFPSPHQVTGPKHPESSRIYLQAEGW